MGHYNELSLDLAADAADLERDGYHDEARMARRSLPRSAQPAAHTPLLIAPILDHLIAAEATARAATADERWLNALDQGYSWLLTQDAISYDQTTGELTYTSESGETYTANGACQCAAFANHQACKHRAAARIVRNALARQSYLDGADQVACAVEALEERGVAYDGGDVALRARGATMGARLSAERRAQNAERERIYAEIEELY